MLEEDRVNYEKFFDSFGSQLKYGIYSSYGSNKEKLEDLLLFKSSTANYTTLKEYKERMQENQENIYYASGETVDKISLLPQVEAVIQKGYEVLYLTEYVDEFTLKSMVDYKDKKFINVSSEELDLNTEEEKEALDKANKENQELLEKIKESLAVTEVKFTNKLTKHPVCLISKGNISIEMEKVINSMPNNENIQAETVMEININHPIVEKLKDLNNKEQYEELEKYSKILYSQARLIEGLSLENPTEISNLVCEILANK